MSYLIFNDYKRSIQSVNLNQVIGNDLSIINSWNLTAQEKATSYLTQKYQTESEFTDTNQWVKSNTYNPNDRVYLDATAYSQATNYNIADNCTYNGGYYVCTTSTTGTFNPSAWSLVNPQYTIYYGAFPYPQFNINTYYNIGDKVFWNGKVYTALQSSASYSHEYLLQINGNPPPDINYFPGQTNPNNYVQWDNGVAYSIPANTDITNTAYWALGDNRSQEMLKVVIDIALYFAHDRISPMNIPELRVNNYKMALQWLSAAADGVITPKLPRRQPNQGNRIRYGGNVRQNWGL